MFLFLISQHLFAFFTHLSMATVYFITFRLDLARHLLFLVALDNVGLVVVSDIFHSIFLNLRQANAEEKLEE